jgi:hypothetical protein
MGGVQLSGSIGKFANLAVPTACRCQHVRPGDLCWRINRVTDTCLIADADEAA